uniref:PD(D/E)XK endonuclease domain-containing protein n=1 Tax=viral metagenome TaxID=1070528 RepID=A0A6M3J0I3_9ZZZZ
MGSMEGNRTGLAGELRVMSELLLRGHNPAKSYLEEGADIILENGLKIEVKSSHRHQAKRTTSYNWNLKCGTRGKNSSKGMCDFVICWCIDDDCFFVIPRAIIGEIIGIYNVSEKSTSKYIQYRDNWELLEVK